jgi:hypothetical protein
VTYPLPDQASSARAELKDLAAAARDLALVSSGAGGSVRVGLVASVRLVLSVSAAAEAAQTHDLDVREISHPPLTWEFSGPAAQVARLVRNYAASARAGAPAEEPR